MDGDEILRQLQAHAPLDGVVRVHTFKGIIDDRLDEITIEVRYWEEENGRSRYHIHAVTEAGERVAGSKAYDSLEMAIDLFHWYAIPRQE